MLIKTLFRSWIRLVALCIALGPVSAQLPNLPPDLSSDPEAEGFADLLFAQGMVKLAEREYAAALPLFEKAASTLPRDATYAYFAGLCQLRLGRHQRAIATLSKTLPPAASRVPEARVRYDLGEARYLSGDLEGAERDFRASLASGENDALARYYLGLTLFRLGRSDAALAELEGAIRVDPSLAGGGAYYLGIAAQQRGDTEEARAQFERVIDSADRQLADSGRQWISSLSPLERAPLPPRGEFRVGLAVEYDDNPGRINDTIGALVPSGEDVRSQLQLRAGYQPMIRQDGLTLGLVLNGSASRHDDFKAADLAGVQGVFQAAWGSDPLGYVNGPLGYARVTPGETRLGWIFQTGVTFVDLDDVSFRRDLEASASVLVRQSGFGKTQLDLQYADRTFFNDPNFQVLTGRVRVARLGQYFFLGRKPDRYLRVAVARSVTDTQFVGLDYDTTQFLAEVALPVSRRWTFFFYGSRSEDDYSSESQIIYGTEREDDRTALIGTGVLAIGSRAYVTLRYGWIDHEVDPDSAQLSYDRRIASAGMTWYW